MGENPREEQGVPVAETPTLERRSLFGVLAGDVNTVATAVAGAYAIKKILDGDADGPKKGGDQDDPSPPEVGPSA
jgi:hypothetical protein